MKEFSIVSIQGQTILQRYDGAHYGDGKKVYFVTFLRDEESIARAREKYIAQGYIEK